MHPGLRLKAAVSTTGNPEDGDSGRREPGRPQAPPDAGRAAWGSEHPYGSAPFGAPVAPTDPRGYAEDGLGYGPPPGDPGDDYGYADRASGIGGPWGAAPPGQHGGGSWGAAPPGQQDEGYRPEYGGPGYEADYRYGDPGAEGTYEYGTSAAGYGSGQGGAGGLGYGPGQGDPGDSGGYGTSGQGGAGDLGYGPGQGDPGAGGGYGNHARGAGGREPAVGDGSAYGYGDPGDESAYGYGPPGSERAYEYGPTAGGYGYGPGYGGPGDGGGYGYGDPAGTGGAAEYAAGPATSLPGGASAQGYDTTGGYQYGTPAGEPPALIVGPTPALRGQPGGAGIEVRGGATGGALAERKPHELSSRSAWQQSQVAWRDSGIEWQRPVTDWEGAEEEWNRIQAGTGTGRQRWSRAPRPPKAPGAAKAASAPRTARTRSRGGSRAGGGGRVAWVAAGVVTAVAVGVAAVVMLGGGGTTSPGAVSSLAPGFPPASLANVDFTTDAGESARAIYQPIGGVASSGSTVVAVGSQAGARIARAQFFVSADGGHSWHLAPVQGPGGGEPPPGHAARLVAGGQGAWVAVGPDAVWTSKDGQSWMLSSSQGIVPMQAGDQVLALARTGNGFIAAGENAPGGKVASSPVLWTSPDGLSWQRLGAGQLRLAAGGGRVLRISFAASHGGAAVIGGVIAATSVKQIGKKKQHVTTYSVGVWRSASGGTAWAPVTVPVSNGASNWIDGLAASGSGFVVIRPATTSGSGRAGVAFVSANGSAWTYGGMITAARTANLAITGVAGSDAGVVASGRVASGNLVAYVSQDGRSWQPTAVLGSASAESVSGATVAPGGTVIAAGASTGDPVSQRPFLALTGAQRSMVNIDVGSIVGATGPAVAVTGIAAAGSRLVAVGSAEGYPAIWSTTGSAGGWSRGSGVTPGVLRRPGLQGLSGVVHGQAGWLAVGGVTGAAAPHPVVVTSAGGLNWQAADGEGAFSAPGTYTAAAAAGPSGYVIVGEQVIPARTRISHKRKQVIQGRTVAAAWWSAGLSGWARGSDAGSGDLDGAGGRQMLAVTASSGGFVAVGSVGGRPAAWTSADGRRWRAVSVPLPAGVGSGVLQVVAVKGSRAVAAGSAVTAAGPVPFAVVSGDGGATWRAAVLGVPGGGAAGGPVSVTAVAAAGGGFTMAGTSGSAGNADVVLWSSADGNVWKASTPSGTGLSGPGVQEITALTASGAALTGVGFTATPLGEQPTLWKALTG